MKLPQIPKSLRNCQVLVQLGDDANVIGLPVQEVEMAEKDGVITKHKIVNAIEIGGEEK